MRDQIIVPPVPVECYVFKPPSVYLTFETCVGCRRMFAPHDPNGPEALPLSSSDPYGALFDWDEETVCEAFICRQCIGGVPAEQQVEEQYRLYLTQGLANACHALARRQ